VIKVRNASVEDAATIVSTRQKVWDATYRGIYPDEMIDDFDWSWHLEAEKRRLSNPSFHCSILLDGEICVGYVSYGVIQTGMWKNFSFRLHSLYLLPPYQGMGLGRSLFMMARKACEEMGFDKMFLDCHPDNHNALEFYQHMGGIIAQVDAGHENTQEDSCTIEYIFNK